MSERSSGVLGPGSPFERCEDCGTVHVLGTSHSCADSTRNDVDSRADRDRLSALDDGDPDDTVVYLPGRGDSAYHGLHPEASEDDPAPACEAVRVKRERSDGRPRTWVPTDRAEARDRSGRYPCRACHDLDEGEP